MQAELVAEATQRRLAANVGPQQPFSEQTIGGALSGLADGHNIRLFGASICANLSRWAIEHECIPDYQNQSPNLSADFKPEAKILAQQQQLPAGTSLETYGPSPLTKLVTNHLFEPMDSIERLVNYYSSDIWLSSGDERTNRLPFIGAGPWKLIYATLIYLYLIKYLLPRLMRPLKPLELNWPIRFYNLFMVLINLWAFFHGARILQFGLKCFGCETINHSDYSAPAIELLHYGWLFFLSRLVEWLDTIFFVLRKKERQVTKLHVFHHSFVPLISWTYLKYHPGYTVAFFPFINSLVHSIMYTYYFLATFGPKVQPYLWWKRYLTSLQIIQFVLIIIQLASIPLTGDETCQYPRGFLYVAFAGAVLFLWLFYAYYLDTYKKSNININHRSKQTNSAKSKENKINIFFQQAQRQNRLGKCREGSSRALSDVIDNAIISCDESAETISKATPSSKKLKSS